MKKVTGTNEIKKQFKSWVILSISCSFMFFIFAPLEVYLTNIQEFWFYAKDLIPVAAVCFVLAGLLFTAAGFLLKKTKIFLYALAVFFCIYVGLYIQGNFIPRNYGVLNGKDIHWEQYSHYAIMSAVLWGMMLVLCIVLCVKMAEQIPAVCSYAGIIVSLILFVTLGTLFIQHIDEEKGKNSVVVSQKDMFSLSEKDNFIVLLYDTFDSSFFREILESEEGDEYREILKDFTYYPDTIGGYPYTRTSMPLILTGQWYENGQPFSDYVKEAYGKTDFYDFLEQNQYTVGVYTMGMFLNDETDRYTNVEKGTYSLTNALGFVKDLYRLVGFNYLPHALKKYAVVYTGDFDQYAQLVSDDKAYAVTDIPEFVDMLKENGISADEKEKNAFRFYHLMGTHVAHEFGEDLHKDGKKYTAVDEAKGCLQSLKSYCDMLKEKGIYENSVIVVMADHGYQSEDCLKGSNPIFMVKEKKAESAFRISDVKVSWDNLLPTMKALISGDHYDGDIWSFDSEIDRGRRFLYYGEGSWEAESMPRMAEYTTMGSPEEDSFLLMPTGSVFSYGAGSADETENIYTVDKMAGISVDDKAWEGFSLYGVSNLETASDGQKFRWTSDKESMFRFAVKDADKNYRVVMKYRSKFQENSNHDIKVRIDDRELDGDCIEVKDNQITVDIPDIFITEGAVRFIVEFPNAVSPRELDVGRDARKLALSLLEVSIEEYDDKSEADKYVVGDKSEILVDQDEWNIFAGKGIGELEFSSEDQPYRWTTGEEAVFEFYTENSSCEGYRFLVHYGWILTEESLKEIRAECNGESLEVSVGAEKQLTIQIPSGCIKNGRGKVILHFPHAVSPKELGQNEDRRKLSAAILGVEMEAYEQLILTNDGESTP